ncbi:MAG TPA: UvrD-helicase domain-containing protein [Anaerolineae bacterium]|nr:UvrD-helicase domain-containing protein [Anaerolineae bacterium]
MLSVEDIHTYYGDSHVLQGVSLTVQSGEVVALLGRNGVGKSTTIHSIIGFTPPRQGRILLRDRDITRLPSHETARLGVGLAPQGRGIFPALTVRENITLAARGPSAESASGGPASGGSASGGSASGGSASGGSASGDASYSNAVFDFFIDPQIDANRRQWLERERWPGMVTAIVGAFIRRAKDLQLTPAAIRARMPSFEADWLLSKMCLEIYEDYQRALANRGSVDFDDLIRLALEALQIDADLLARLQRKWPYILEDEAQDSSYLQERILRLLTDEGNWVRVGDPNQSINTTFTTSDIRFLNQFLDEEDVVDSPLLHSGRSTQRIVDLANYLVEWTNMAHPNPVVRERAFRTQRIYPVPPGDAQPNPADTPDLVVQLYNEALAPEKEIDLVVRSLQRWLPEHKHATVAVLAPDNTRGFKVSERLKAAGIEYDELLRSTASTREATRRLAHVLRYLSAPLSGSLLAKVFEVYARPAEGDEADAQAARDRKLILTGLRRLDQVEAFIWPRPDRDELPEFAPASDPAIRAQLIEFRRVVQRWLAASHLPIDQLVLTVAQDVYREGDADQVVRHLALAHKIALVLRRLAADRPEWRLPDLAAELDRVANNEQRFLGFSEDDLSFTPRPGRVTVATMHKAKGLEWDRVYLLGVNNFDFPSAAPGDVYRGETWYVRGRLNLEAEGVAQLETLAEGGGYVPGVATNEARLAYAEERLRLLYVGITRARRELIITWNTGPREDEPHQAAAAFLGLWSYWESVQKPAGE